jgi:tetratricopeptide (TPR) repeat protein
MSTKTEQPVYWFCLNEADLKANTSRFSEMLSGKQYRLLTKPAEFFLDLERTWHVPGQPTKKTKRPLYSTFFRKWAESLPQWTVHSILGRILHELGHHGLAFPCYREAIKVAGTEWALALNNLRASESCLGFGDLKRAKVYLASAERHAKHTKDAPLRAAIISRRGDALYRRLKSTTSKKTQSHKLDFALQTYQDALEMMKSISPQGFREKSEIAYLYSQTGILCRELSRFKKSIESFSASYASAREIGHYWLKGHALTHRSRALTRCGHVQEAGLDALIAIKILQSFGDRVHALGSVLEAVAGLLGVVGGDCVRRYGMEAPPTEKRIRLPFYIGYGGVQRGGDHFVFLPELDELICVNSLSNLDTLCAEHLTNRKVTVKAIAMTECDSALLDSWRSLFGRFA